MKEQYKIFFELLRSAILGRAPAANACELGTEELDSLFALAKKHDLAHLIAHAIKAGNGSLKLSAELDRSKLMAIYRYSRLSHEYDCICKVLSQAGIRFMPLKGSYIRTLYPEGWMRTSCDIDVLVDEDRHSDAVLALEGSLGYKIGAKSSHDVSLFSQNGVHIELHYALAEVEQSDAIKSVLAEAWDRSSPKESSPYHYEMSDPMLYFYHIAHMAKHFEIGGCGIRPFADIAILEKNPGADKAKRDELLERGGLLKFDNAARALSAVWFGDAEHTDITEKMETYILTGGVYGNSENQVALQQQKAGGRLKYALSKIFLPYEVLKFQYPAIVKHKWLTPFMEVRRWFRIAFFGGARRSLSKLSKNANITKDEAASMKSFLEEIGIS